MFASDRTPPMLDRTARHFPIHVADPGSVFTSPRFIVDLEVLGLWNVDPRTFVRALCTIGTDVADVLLSQEADLAAVHAEDRCTAWLTYDTGIEYQVEFFLDGNGFASLSTIEELPRNQDTRLLIVCDTPPSGSATNDCDTADQVEIYPLISEPRERITIIEG
ncbi:hypothetical protein ACFQHN_22565 [Natrialbaceae archaeon GCM10025896]